MSALQWGEDGILESVFMCIGTTNKRFAEFGAESGQEVSTRWLREGHGFKGRRVRIGKPRHALISCLPCSHACMRGHERACVPMHAGVLLDGGPENPAINLRHQFILAKDISDVLKASDVPYPSPDHMTIDLDQNTWHVAQAVMKGGWRPRWDA